MPLSHKVSSDSPIGMFDSGFGGLTVARALIDLMPNENLVYIGDTGRYPYGNKPADEVRGFAKELAWSLVNEYGAKMIVVACNTAASVALDELVDEFRLVRTCRQYEQLVLPWLSRVRRAQALSSLWSEIKLRVMR
jgi:glutamate racemase